ncbi:DUF3089 domain-containing protein [Woodsholea maritima]|uniref:DUF3089 domain-containing protein n=1 Tax=Woodsholea maritima TaxID=240237 RepID=UPI0003A2E138|nr:DUF3089 domain-containing protein [Woodsholea maritima]
MRMKTPDLTAGLVCKILLICGMGFVILLALASWVLRDQIFQTALDPGVPYQTYDLSRAPDYNAPDSWIVQPDPAALADDTHPAVFFIHPTTYDGGSHWNAPFDRPQERIELDDIVIPNFAAPFARSGAVFAPHYRQAALYAFMNMREDSVQARLTAASDVRHAFLAFKDQIGDLRPFILVGYGQGGMDGLQILLSEIAPDEDLAKRMVAAYLLETPVPLDVLDENTVGLKPCHQPNDVRCVISFNSLRANEKNRIQAITERNLTWAPEGGLSSVEDRALLCVNPLLWTTGEDYAPARLHKGGAAAQGMSFEDTPSPLAAQTGAQCQNGLLIIERPRSSLLRRPHRLREERRVPPYNLFYMDIQQDVARRTALLQDILADERRYAPELPPLEEVRDVPVRPIDPPQ